MFVPHYQGIWKEGNMPNEELKLSVCKEILHTLFSHLEFITPDEALETLNDCYNNLNVLTDSKYDNELAEYTKHLIE